VVINIRRSTIIAESCSLKSEDVEKFSFLDFCQKTAPYGKFFKILFLGSKGIHCDTDRRVVFKFREIWLTGIGKILHTVRIRK